MSDYTEPEFDDVDDVNEPDPDLLPDVDEGGDE